MAWDRVCWPDTRLASGVRVRVRATGHEYTVSSLDEYMMLGEVTLENDKGSRVTSYSDNLEVYVPDPAPDPGPSYWADRAEGLAALS